MSMDVVRGAGVLLPLDFEIWYFPISLLVYFSFSVELVKIIFPTIAPLEKSFWAPPGKIHYCPVYRQFITRHFITRQLITDI